MLVLSEVLEKGTEAEVSSPQTGNGTVALRIMVSTALAECSGESGKLRYQYDGISRSNKQKATRRKYVCILSNGKHKIILFNDVKQTQFCLKQGH